MVFAETLSITAPTASGNEYTFTEDEYTINGATKSYTGSNITGITFYSGVYSTFTQNLSGNRFFTNSSWYRQNSVKAFLSGFKMNGSGSVSNNVLNISDMTDMKIGAIAGLAIVDSTYGNLDSTNNTLNLSNVTQSEDSVIGICGGFTDTRGTTVSDNVLNVNNSTVREVIGGYTFGGNALNNSVTVRESKITNLYGGRSVASTFTRNETYETELDSGRAEGNSVNVSDSIITNIRGGYIQMIILLIKIAS